MKCGLHRAAPLFLPRSLLRAQAPEPFVSSFHSLLLAAPAPSLSHTMTRELLGRLLSNRLLLALSREEEGLAQMWEMSRILKSARCQRGVCAMLLSHAAWLVK